MEINPKLCIVIPCYNEEQVLPVTVPLFLQELGLLMEQELISHESRILLVNDGSRDATWDMILKFAEESPCVTGISLSRNRGHQNALFAGLMEAVEAYDITISIDCDGQDDIRAMEEMVKEYHAGAEIVYGVRSRRDTDTVFKRMSAQGFYRFLKWMGVEVVYNHADYRLVSSRVLRELASFKEVNIFLRGMFPLVGFKSTCVYYERTPRMAGESHYPLSKMLRFALDGITSLSIRPLRMITVFGITISLVTFVLIIYALVQFFCGNTVPGWSSTLIVTAFIGGIQLISLGVIGEYVGRIYMESKARPRYIISDRTKEKQEICQTSSEL